MTKKAFSILLLFALAFGSALGVAFAAGVALGKSQGPDPSQEASSLRPPRSSQDGGFRPGGRDGRDARAGAEQGGREGGFSRRSGEPSGGPEGGPRTGDSARGPAGSSGVIGTVNQVQDNLVTLNTPQGRVQVRLLEETTIQNTAEGTIADLVEGASIRIIGRRDQEGNVQARAVTLLLEDSEDLDANVLEGGRRADFDRRTPVTGAIVSVVDGIVTVDGPDGPVKATLREETFIQKTTEGTEADLVEGVRVRVIGRTGDAGNIVARSLTVVPEDAGGFFGRRGERGRQ